VAPWRTQAARVNEVRCTFGAANMPTIQSMPWTPTSSSTVRTVGHGSRTYTSGISVRSTGLTATA
jgi:hypothetical protein